MATPVKIAFATVLVSQTFALILMFPLGHAGLTLSTSIGACLNAGLLFWFLRKRGIYRRAAGWLLFVSKLVVALFALAAVLLWLGGPASFWLSATLWPKVGRLAGVCAAGAAAYFGGIVAAGIPVRRFQPPDVSRRAARRTPSRARFASGRRGDVECAERAPARRQLLPLPLRCGQRGFTHSAYR